MAERRFRKGDRVQFRFGVRTIQGVIREDRGPIGVDGRRLYRIEFTLPSEYDPTDIELPAASLQLVQDNIAAE